MTPAQQQLFAAYRQRAVNIACSSYMGRVPPYLRDDLTQAALIGLWQTIERCEGYERPAFHTYLKTRVRGAAIDALRAADWLTRRARESYGEDLRCVSLDGLGTLRAPEAPAQLDLEPLLRSLPERERQTIELFLADKSLYPLAAAWGVSRPRVWQIRQSAFAKLRTKLDRNGDAVVVERPAAAREIRVQKPVRPPRPVVRLAPAKSEPTTASPPTLRRCAICRKKSEHGTACSQRCEMVMRHRERAMAILQARVARQRGTSETNANR